MQAYLRAEVGLSRLRAVELQTLPDTLPQHVQGGVGLHDLGHGLRDEGLHPSEPVPKGAVQVVCQVNTNHHPCMRTTSECCLRALPGCTKQGYVVLRHEFEAKADKRSGLWQ